MALTFATQSFADKAEVYSWQGASVVDLLTSSATRSKDLGALAPEFVVAADRGPLILTANGNLFDLKQGEYVPAASPIGATSFAYSNDHLVVVRNNRLGWYEYGYIVERIALPSPHMKVVAGKGEHLYLYGPSGAGSTVYLLEGNRILPLLRISHGKIADLTAIGDRIFFAIDNAIYTVTKGEQAGLVFVAAGEKRIRSLAVDTIAGMLYFSAGEAVYIMRAGVALTILKGLEGILRYSKNALFVLDPGRRRLVKILGLERLIIGGGESTGSIKSDAFKE